MVAESTKQTPGTLSLASITASSIKTEKVQRSFEGANLLFPGKKRKVNVGAIVAMTPFERTAQDVVDEVLRQRKQLSRPKPQDKRLRAERAEPVDRKEVKGKERIITVFTEEAAIPNPKVSASSDLGTWPLIRYGLSARPCGCQPRG